MITPDEWPDYRELGIGPEHIPELYKEKAAQKKAKSKMAKLSRKKNRKR